MTAPPLPDPLRVPVELERLRGAVDTGFATLNGRLDVALQRTTSVETDLTELERRIVSLERARWPLPSIAALIGLASMLITLYEVLNR
ncbi:hypothetical protein [Streptomyces sp. NPDC001404]|uniref:hypothetical protein n=1 Tax=Streptomyces sp. NPDC001404 TaxID=3364571 RepID=UPI0036765E60